MQWNSSLAWPDRYISIQGAIAFSMSARKKIGSGVVPIVKSFLTPPSRPEVSIVAGHLEAPQDSEFLKMHVDRMVASTYG